MSVQIRDTDQEECIVISKDQVDQYTSFDAMDQFTSCDALKTMDIL